MKVFLGGTCNKTTWREELIPLLTIDYFNPVVKDWTPECQEIEKQQKELCNIHDLINERGGYATINSDYLGYCSEMVNSYNTNVARYAERMR